jgi:hypothetical protein
MSRLALMIFSVLAIVVLLGADNFASAQRRCRRMRARNCCAQTCCVQQCNTCCSTPTCCTAPCTTGCNSCYGGCATGMPATGMGPTPATEGDGVTPPVPPAPPTDTGTASLMKAPAVSQARTPVMFRPASFRR